MDVLLTLPNTPPATLSAQMGANVVAANDAQAGADADAFQRVLETELLGALTPPPLDAAVAGTVADEDSARAASGNEGNPALDTLALLGLPMLAPSTPPSPGPDGKPVPVDADRTGTLSLPPSASGLNAPAAMATHASTSAGDAAAPENNFAREFADHLDSGGPSAHGLPAPSVETPSINLQAAAQSHAPPPPPPIHHVEVPAAVGSRVWHEQIGQSVSWMVNARIQHAELHVNPPELGPVEIRIAVDGDLRSAATVQFVASQSATRDALEAGLPRLREMLAESGITLSEASVGGQPGQPGEDASARQKMSASRPPAPSGEATMTLLPLPTRADGWSGIDTFA